jgi:predicted Rossmann fold nucleotide-binding protein DprA/Smf involved in DNA uptake
MQSDTDRKAAMKQLRQERRQSIKNATAAMKAQRKTVKAIQAALAAGAATVPEIAVQTGTPTDRVLWFIATMKKYGQVVEDGKDGGYYRYTATAAVREDNKTGDHP